MEIINNIKNTIRHLESLEVSCSKQQKRIQVTIEKLKSNLIRLEADLKKPKVTYYPRKAHNANTATNPK